MSGTEFALNRPLLREVNQRLKGFSQYDGASSLKSGQNELNQKNQFLEEKVDFEGKKHNPGGFKASPSTPPHPLHPANAQNPFSDTSTKKPNFSQKQQKENKYSPIKPHPSSSSSGNANQESNFNLQDDSSRRSSVGSIQGLRLFTDHKGIPTPPKDPKEHRITLQNLNFSPENQLSLSMISAQKNTKKPLNAPQKATPHEVSLSLIPQKPPDSSKIENQLKISKLKKIEKSNFYWKKFCIIIAVLFSSLAVTFLRGGKNFKSVIGVKKCDPTDWTIFGVYVAIILLFSIISAVVVYSEQKEKLQAGWKFSKYEKNFDLKFIVLGNFFGILMGFVSANVGIGGGLMITPLLLSYDFLPTVVSYTGMYLVFANKLVSTTVFLLSGSIPVNYMLFIGLFLVFGVLVAEFKISKFVKNSGRPSIISFIFVGIVLVSMCLVVYTGVSEILEKLGEGEPVLEFQPFCPVD